MNNKYWKQKALTPVLLNETDKAYNTVLDLQNAIKQNDILNIAVTGPFGSGKSSVLHTFMTNADTDTKVLDISLATLEADESVLNTQDDIPQNKKDQKKDRLLNRKIEYSILQQLVYRKTLEELPYSRMLKIRHFDAHAIRLISSYIVGFVVLIAFAMNSSFLQIPLLYKMFWIPKNVQDAISVISVMILSIMLYDIIKILIKNYGGIHPSKLSFAGTEVNVRDERSIFNIHLDEILYFFQCTDYNVVIIEDLDRFNTTEIFLKLRELNHLINKSEMVGRTVKFIYAVKDDMFKDSSRTKFFDYITTVIPVITTSNSKVKLKEALKDLGHENEINDEDIRDIAFHIDDMRLLHNIVNEYHQYTVRLNDNDHPFEAKKMLAMITLKNYHPHDFADLHNRSGKLYQTLCPETKRRYIDFAINKRIAQREETAKQSLKAFNANCHLSLKELRISYLMAIVNKVSNQLFSIQIDGISYRLMQAAENDDVFDKIRKGSSFRYVYYGSNYYGSQNATLNYNFSEIEKEINPNFTYAQRATAICSNRKKIEEVLAEIEMEKNNVRAFPICDLIEKYDIYDEDFFKAFMLSDLEEDFIRRGFVAEDYNDYISYFYPGIMSKIDHDLCMDIKLNRPNDYSVPVGNVELVLKELPTTAFRYKSIWNYHILDFLAVNSEEWKDKYALVVDNLIKNTDSYHFLYGYIRYGGQANKVFSDCMHVDSQAMWSKAKSAEEKEQTELLRMWLMECAISDIHKAQIIWINKHFDIIVSISDHFNDEKKKHFVENYYYETLFVSDSQLLREVISNGCYVINEHNMPIVVEVKKSKDDITRLKEIEEMQLAMKMDLISVTWQNLLGYFDNCGNTIDEVLANYIEKHIELLTKEPACSDDKYESLLQHLLECSKFSNSVYREICEVNSFYINLNEKVMALPIDKLKMLIETGAIDYNIETLKSLNKKSEKLTLAYIIYYNDKLSDILSTGILTTTLAVELLNYGGFNTLEYQRIISFLNPSAIKVNEALANRLCDFIAGEYSVCDDRILFEAIRLCNNKPHAVYTATRRMKVSLSDHQLMRKLLELLPKEYHELAELGKQPKYKEAPYNTFLIQTLKEADFISSFCVDKGMIKVYTKRKRGPEGQ